jgi:hypothetical protein
VWNKIFNWTIVFFTVFSLNAQSVISPTATSYPQSTSNQVVSGFSVNGFNPSSTLLITIGLVNPPSGTTLRLNTTAGVTASTGYSLTSNFTRISFTGTMANVNNVLSSLRLNTGSVPGNVYIAVTATENPVGYFYLPSNGHFYRPISSGAFYTSAKSAAAATNFKGQQGYLVTITSADEDAFIFNNVPQSQIWFALSDAAQEGFWRIDAGPENGTLIKTQNGQFAGNIVGQYNNWAPGEPNNSGGEHYAVTKWNGSQWNDLPNGFSCPYVIEYGTWTDPANQTFTDFFTGFVTHQISCSPATSPTAPTGTNGSRMNAGTVVISATPPAGSTIDWYANSVGGNVISAGLGVTTYTTPSITNTTTYFAQSRNTTNGCVSSTRTAVVATVNYPVPFIHSGFVYGAEGVGIPNISVKLFRKLNSETNYTLHGTYTTTSNGQFNITTTLDISLYNFQLVIDNITISNPNVSDAQFFNQKILTQGFSSKDFYRLNTNGNNILTISDVYEVYQKTYNVPWETGVATYRLFNQTEWNVINSSYGDLRTTYPGVQGLTIQSPINNGTSNIYLIRTGYAN